MDTAVWGKIPYVITLPRPESHVAFMILTILKNMVRIRRKSVIQYVPIGI